MTNKPLPVHDFHWSFTGRKIRGPHETPLQDITLKDVAVGLSLLCRFRGMTGRFYSVAEHSVLCAKHFMVQGDIELARMALLHDAHEAYTGDVVSPQKRHIAGWREYEDAWEARVREALGLPPQDDERWRQVASIDHAIVHREAFHLFPTVPPWYDRSKGDTIHPSCVPEPMGPDKAREWFEAAAFILGCKNA